MEPQKESWEDNLYKTYSFQSLNVNKRKGCFVWTTYRYNYSRNHRPRTPVEEIEADINELGV